MKKQFTLGLITGLLLIIPTLLFAQPNLTSRLAGRILLQVENKGEAWYINPLTNTRFFLGRPENAFEIMRKQGLGITNSDLDKITIDKGSENPRTIVYEKAKVCDWTIYKKEIEKLNNKIVIKNIINDTLEEKYNNLGKDYDDLLKKYSDFNDQTNQFATKVIKYMDLTDSIIAKNLYCPYCPSITAKSYQDIYQEKVEEIERKRYLKSISDSLEKISIYLR